MFRDDVMLPKAGAVVPPPLPKRRLYIKSTLQIVHENSTARP